VRWARAPSARRARVEESIRELEGKLQDPQVTGAARDMLEKQHALYVEVLAAAGRRAPEADRLLIERRFDELDAHVPQQFGG